MRFLIGRGPRATSSEQDLNKLIFHACAMRYPSLDWLTAAHCQVELVVWPFCATRKALNS